MPTSSILFDPEIDERSLDREVNQVNDQLGEAATGIQPEFDAEGMDALRPPGMEDGPGGIGPGTAGGVGALASRIPKSVAGVTAAAALPVALSGGVGMSMVSAMHGASARLQTSTSLMSQAWNSVWRPLGDKLDQLFIRDIATDILSETRNFEETLRSGEWATAISELTIGVTGDSGLFERMGSLFGAAGGGLAGVKAGMTAGAAAGSVIPGAGTAAGGLVGAGLGGLMGVIFGGRVGGGLGFDFGQWWNNNINIPDWPGWPDVKGLWPEWPEVKNLWPGWPDGPGGLTDWPGWPDIDPPTWPSADDILSQFPTISVDQFRDWILGGGGNGGNGGNGRDVDLPPGRFNPSGDTGGGGGFWDNILTGVNVPGLQSGGRVTSSGVANVHRGELVADPDRLVSELAGAIDSADTGGSVDMSRVEGKLDELNRNVTRLASALEGQTLEVGGEAVARVSESGKRDRVTDTNPMV